MTTDGDPTLMTLLSRILVKRSRGRMTMVTMRERHLWGAGL